MTSDLGTKSPGRGQGETQHCRIPSATSGPLDTLASPPAASVLPILNQPFRMSDSAAPLVSLSAAIVPDSGSVGRPEMECRTRRGVIGYPLGEHIKEIPLDWQVIGCRGSHARLSRENPLGSSGAPRCIVGGVGGDRP